MSLGTVAALVAGALQPWLSPEGTAVCRRLQLGLGVRVRMGEAVLQPQGQRRDAGGTPREASPVLMEAMPSPPQEPRDAPLTSAAGGLTHAARRAALQTNEIHVCFQEGSGSLQGTEVRDMGLSHSEMLQLPVPSSHQGASLFISFPHWALKERPSAKFRGRARRAPLYTHA